MTTNQRNVVVVAALALSLHGCAVGYNSVLFAMRSNVGIDLDSTPPTAEIAVSRQEGVIEPVFEGGQTLPVMASFSAKSGPINNFFWGVGSTFATGQAAQTMAWLYDRKTPEPETKPDLCPVTLSKEPEAKLPFGHKAAYVGPGDVKPVVFGTDTNLGLKISWTGETAQYPSAVNLGFKRKEFAIAPISLTEKTSSGDCGSDRYQVTMPSLLATLDTDVAVVGQGANLSYLQYFATGDAADRLAREHGVRVAILRRADPLAIQESEAEDVAQRAAIARGILGNIADGFEAAEAQRKEQIIAEAKRLGLVADNVGSADFVSSLGKLTSADTTTIATMQQLESFVRAR